MSSSVTSTASNATGSLVPLQVQASNPKSNIWAKPLAVSSGVLALTAATAAVVTSPLLANISVISSIMAAVPFLANPLTWMITSGIAVVATISTITCAIISNRALAKEYKASSTSGESSANTDTQDTTVSTDTADSTQTISSILASKNWAKALAVSSGVLALTAATAAVVTSPLLANISVISSIMAAVPFLANPLTWMISGGIAIAALIPTIAPIVIGRYRYMRPEGPDAQTNMSN